MMNNKAKTPTLLTEIQHRVRYANRQRWFRLAVTGRTNSGGRGFFDDYPRFFTTSTTHAERDRLNQRHRALIESNAEIIAGKRILDLASHDGRWSFAAHQAGAADVVGIEARPHLVDAARINMREYGVAERKVQFVQGDMFAELDRLQPGCFDTVFCFGFFYHTLDHMPLLRKIARLAPKNLILDTLISVSPANIIEMKAEKVETESNGAIGELGSPTHIVIGKPSKSALELMLQAAGFRVQRYYDWSKAGVKRWDDLEVYYLGERVSLTCEASGFDIR